MGFIPLQSLCQIKIRADFLKFIFHANFISGIKFAYQNNPLQKSGIGIAIAQSMPEWGVSSSPEFRSDWSPEGSHAGV